MLHDLSLAQCHAYELSCILMVPVTLFRLDDGFAVLPSEELDSMDVDLVHEFDPFEPESFQ